jgi:hypothetical protein
MLGLLRLLSARFPSSTAMSSVLRTSVKCLFHLYSCSS